MSVIQDEYERIAYPHYVHPLTDAARLAAVGRLLGVPTADPAGCRVLDLGCGGGTNLLAMAARFPGGRFHGVDFCAPEVRAAQALAAEAGLGNVTVEEGDLLRWEPGGERYDYVVAYGVFSWVPDEVKERLLQTVRAALAPQGIACISYLTWPGAQAAEALRELLRLRTAGLEAPEARVGAAHGMLDFLDRAWAAQPGPHAGFWRAEGRRMRAKEPHFLLLDDLGVVRDPCYLLQFTQWAGEHGLRYLGESELASILPENLPGESARALAGLQLGRLETEQVLDYVTNRAFRCSLLVGPEAAVAEGLEASALRGLCLAPRLEPVAAGAWGAEEGRFTERDGPGVTLRSVPLVAVARALAERPGARTPYGEVLAAAQRGVGRDFSAEEERQLGADLLALYGQRRLEVSGAPFTPPAELPERPRLTEWNRVLSERRGLLVTAGHEGIRLEPEEAACCALLDGRRTVREIGLAPAGRALGEKLLPHLQTLRRLGCLAFP